MDTDFGINETFIYKLLPTWSIRWETFPELAKQTKLVSDVIKEEESNFLKTIEHGLVHIWIISSNRIQK